MEFPFIVDPSAGEGVELPAMFEVRQHFDLLPAVDPLAALATEWPRAAETLTTLAPGASIAVAVGSRGITGIAAVVRDVVGRLRATGFDPFIVPAMGSHGGATAAGQAAVLADLGVAEEGVGAPVRSSMDVVSLGEVDGIPLFLDRHAWDADGIVLVNRVKPHTDFTGHIESGLMKLLVIGLGKQKGADHYHSLGVVRGLGETIPTAARALLLRANVLFGVALVENEEHQTAVVRVLAPADIEDDESYLLDLARSHLPGLPMGDIDLLILDEMGKDVSGNGLDPNVTGRNVTSWATHPERPRITRIFVRDLTAASHGNACGLGNVDAITPRFLERFDFAASVTNALTSSAPEDARIPPVFLNDRHAITTLLTTMRPTTPDDVRIVYARNTLEVSRLWVSRGCLEQLPGEPAVTVDAAPRALVFDGVGDLESPFAPA